MNLVYILTRFGIVINFGQFHLFSFKINSLMSNDMKDFIYVDFGIACEA